MIGFDSMLQRVMHVERPSMWLYILQPWQPGEIMIEKKPVLEIRNDMQSCMAELTAGVRSFIEARGFYPSVFYNENDINDPVSGIRKAIPDLDNYPGVFIHQDSPETPIAGYKGLEFRTSILKSTAKKNNQLLWTVQNIPEPSNLMFSIYDENPSVQFCGTVVYMPDGNIFPQQAPRVRSIQSLSTCGIKTQINMKVQQFVGTGFEQISGCHLTDAGYRHLMDDHIYGLSVRGWGNWDYRFYELLAAGRIPVHINTDDELLFEREIPWNDLIVIVNNLSDIKKNIDEFHEQFTDTKSLVAHQKKLVKLYREHLTFPAFCKHFEEYYEDDLRWMLRQNKSS